MQQRQAKIDQLCPQRHQLNSFRECIGNREMLRAWHLKNTPWVNAQLLEKYLDGYEQEIALIDQQLQQQNQEQQIIEENKNN